MTYIYLSTSLLSNQYSLVSSERMEIMKSRGCVYDGLLTPRYNRNFQESVNMLKRSDCRYIHRSVETWNIPPDFKEIQRRINVINRAVSRDIIYSMFIAESLDITKGYYDPYQKRWLRLSAMCMPGTFGAWGKNTCKPSLQKKEYRIYLNSIMKRAIDLGIEDFTFGQIYYQDANWKKDASLIRGVIANAKKYAKSKGMDISIGAQTNTMDNELYLRSFDYITGGIGQNKNGEIQKEGSCWEYYYKRDGYCWAMLWDKKFKNKSNNVLVYLDWNNSSTDDIHRFTRMNRQERANFLGSAYDYFLWHDVGLLMPLGVVLGNVSAGCYGPTREFYSASNKYSCKDEVAINNVFSGGNLLPNHSRFISQDIPLIMEAGKKYTVRITMQNTSYRPWKKSDNFKLGSWNPQDNYIWGVNRIEFSRNDNVQHGDLKSFIFDIIAPEDIGEYNFQWKMVEEGVDWFGETTEKIKIKVVTPELNIKEKESAEVTTISNNQDNILSTKIVETSSNKEDKQLEENNLFSKIRKTIFQK